MLALRFDVDSLTCLERGIPALLRLGQRRAARFTFFVNMGRSFSWRYTTGRMLERFTKRKDSRAAPRSAVPDKLSATTKLGLGGTLKTVALNPRLGRRYRRVLDVVHREGHELGLHGGTNHAVWQYGLDSLSAAGLDHLLRPAFREFRNRYGRPRGFASPGFRHNLDVLELMDDFKFKYASDMTGNVPFRPRRVLSAASGDADRETQAKRGHRYDHFQVPVNVIGERGIPLIEQSLARGLSQARTVDRVLREVRKRRFAHLYGHPYLEGVRWRVLEEVLREVSDEYDVVPVEDYLVRWEARSLHE